MNLQISIIIMIIILLLVICLGPQIKGAPWIPTGMKKVRRMLSLAEVQPEEILYDLGCGDGRFILTAARKFKAKAVGIEINPLLYLWCQLTVIILGLRRRVKIKYGNFFKQSLSDADVVICYLLQETNDKLEEKLLRELKPTARVVSKSFLFKNLSLVSEDIENSIYVYCIRKDKATNQLGIMDKENEFKIKEEELTQRIIDPTTGNDITGEFVNQRLKELEKIADKIIRQAINEFKKDKSNKKNIYQKAYWEIHEKLGMGSIGPATAAAGPLMEKNLRELALVLEISSEDRI